jgi:hypothetical protein
MDKERLSSGSASSIGASTVNFATGSPSVENKTVTFEAVRESEHAAINQRRAESAKVGPFPCWNVETTAQAAVDPSAEGTVYDTIGLALSGGGIRSAAFCLGALQALDVAKAFKHIDYLSTVSGGGYIGSSLSAGMTEKLAAGEPNEIPFESSLEKDETPVVQHIRDYSNYLVPHGFFDVLEGIAIYLRGLAANALLVVPWLFFAAALTIRLYPTRNSLRAGSIFGFPLPDVLSGHFFALTLCLLAALLVLLLGWSLIKSAQYNLGQPEVPGGAAAFFGASLIVIALSFFCELQPYVIAALFDAAAPHDTSASPLVIVSLIHYGAVGLAPIAAIIGFLGNKIGSFVSKVTETDGFRTRALAVIGKVAMIASALVIPVLLWVVYLQFCYWGISANVAHLSADSGWRPDYMAPVWVKDVAELLPDLALGSPIGTAYALGWFVLFLLSACLSPNANSLHRLYRDRLSKAFIVCPEKKLETATAPIKTIDKIKLSALNSERSPYHLLNAALNVQASKYANRRGRNADFFLFSRNYVGSATTGYVATKQLEDKVPEVDLATAMAISGAAASSNMGSSSVRQWTLSLAMLNVRLGYWLRNPRFLSGQSRFAEVFYTLFNPYFLYEAFGLLNERRWFVNLSDGGHIENLGVYELLRRRCCLIIVVDAEADPRMNFGSFVTLQRYARIDLGIRIELPWSEIRAVTLDTDQAVRAADGVPPAIVSRAGPHCAVGKIYYPEGEGRILYVKSSVSGDENDYVMEYKRRHASFPHETTGDQFFTEEQFEAYRALGFHALQGFFSGRDHVAAFDDQVIDQVKRVLKFTKPTRVLPTLQPRQ